MSNVGVMVEDEVSVGVRATCVRDVTGYGTSQYVSHEPSSTDI